MTAVLLCLGGNLGEPAAAFRDVVGELGDRVLRASRIYRTPPWGDPDQPPYLNAVVLADDETLDPHGWLDLAQHLEREAGRVRDPERRFGPRTLDVDLIAAWDGEGRAIESHDDRLTLPHPRAHLRAFVLVPWTEVDPDAVLPGRGRVADLLTEATLADDASRITPAGEPLR